MPTKIENHQVLFRCICDDALKNRKNALFASLLINDRNDLIPWNGTSPRVRQNLDEVRHVLCWIVEGAVAKIHGRVRAYTDRNNVRPGSKILRRRSIGHYYHHVERKDRRVFAGAAFGF